MNVVSERALLSSRLSATPGRFALKGVTVLSMDPSIGNLSEADIVVDDGRIAEVRPGAADTLGEDWVVIDARGCVVIPGFVDTHKHAWENQLRHTFPDVTLTDYAIACHLKLAPRFRPEDMYAGSHLTALSSLNAGTTCVVDWSHNSRTPDHCDAVVDALEDSGARAVYAFAPPMYLGGEHAHPSYLDRLHHERFSSEDQLVSMCMATFLFNLPRYRRMAGDPPNRRQEAHDVVRAAREHGLRISFDGVHGSQMSDQVLALHRAGLTGDDITYIHCNGLSDETWSVMADTGGSVSVSATSEVLVGLTDFTPATQRAIDVGIMPSLSTDVEVSLPGDMFSLMRSVMEHQRRDMYVRLEAGDETAPEPLTTSQVLEFATLGGARAAGLDHRVGSITPGKDADLVLIRGTIANRPITNAVGSVVMGSDTANVDSVFVRGRARKLLGELVGVDVGAVIKLAEDSRDHLLAQFGLEPDPAVSTWDRLLIDPDRDESTRDWNTLYLAEPGEGDLTT